MGIRINMENKIDELERRLYLAEGAIEDLLNIYKEGKDGKEKKTTKTSKKSSNKKASSTKTEK